MKRDPRLHSLSSDHHRALVMARKMSKASRENKIDPAILKEIELFCCNELQPHFIREEQTLLPALEKHGEHKLVRRTFHEHQQMTELAGKIKQKDALQQLSQLLKQHIRFEEQTLFRISQEKLSDEELETINKLS